MQAIGILKYLKGQGDLVTSSIRGITRVTIWVIGMYLGAGVYSSIPPEVDRIWLWGYYNKIPIYPILYLLKGDYILLRMGGSLSLTQVPNYWVLGPLGYPT